MQIKWAASWTPSSVFTPSSVNDKSVYDFKRAVFANAENHTVLHEFDLMGRLLILPQLTLRLKPKTVHLKNSTSGRGMKCSGEFLVR
jgi:hypothetical protein